jgi:hypothetical protein
MELHGVYATSRAPEGGTQRCFRIGSPISHDTAHLRWDRLDRARRETGLVVHDSHDEAHRIDFVEVRAVDDAGRGLGSERHWTAEFVPCAHAVPV